jgi:hypothetical protein
MESVEFLGHLHEIIFACILKQGISPAPLPFMVFRNIMCNVRMNEGNGI